MVQTSPANPLCEPAEAMRALERVLGSQVFRKAQRSRRFLRYVVENALKQPGGVLKEYTLAVDVFDRDAGYDPTIDATVRVEAGRLRSRLREYYDEEGATDPWAIELPKGGYNVSFIRRLGREQSAVDAGQESQAPERTQGAGGPDKPRDPDFEELTKAYTRWFWAAIAIGLLLLGLMLATVIAVRQRIAAGDAVRSGRVTTEAFVPSVRGGGSSLQGSAPWSPGTQTAP